MDSCSVCGEGVNDLPYVCNYCGQIHCVHHRLPESHDCLGIENWDKIERVLENGFEYTTKSELKQENDLSNQEEEFIELVDENTDSQEDKSIPVWHQNAYRTVEPIVMGTTPSKEEAFLDSSPDVAPDGSIIFPEEEASAEVDPEVESAGGMSRTMKIYTAGLLIIILVVIVYVVVLS